MDLGIKDAQAKAKAGEVKTFLDSKKAIET